MVTAGYPVNSAAGSVVRVANTGGWTGSVTGKSSSSSSSSSNAVSAPTTTVNVSTPPSSSSTVIPYTAAWYAQGSAAAQKEIAKQAASINPALHQDASNILYTYTTP